MVPTVFGITLVIFCLLSAAPGDPATIKFGVFEQTQEGSDIQARIDKFNSRYGFNQPLWKQYLSYLGPVNMKDDGHRWFGGTGREPWGGLLAFDLGSELLRPTVRVSEELTRRLAVTVPLSLVSALLSYMIALPLGIYSAARQGSLGDGLTSVSLFVLYSIPTFWAGLMLILVFGKTGLDWFPSLGLHDKDADLLSSGGYVWDMLKHAVLPVATLTYGSLAYLSRQMRVGMVDVIRQDYIRTARAKGLPERVVVLRHALRNSLIPVLTLFASVLPILIGGSIIVEKVFDIPGMGSYAYEGLLERDINVVMATTTFSAVMTLMGILLSDISYAFADPRIRYE